MSGRNLPDVVEGCGWIVPFDGVPSPPATVMRAPTRFAPHARGRDKLLGSIEAAFVACGIGDGATLSFHHHLRDGDQVLNQVLAVAARRGLRGLTVAASSLFPVHAPLVEHLVERLDAMLLGAAEIDLDFNVNVTTGSGGKVSIFSGKNCSADATACRRT